MTDAEAENWHRVLDTDVAHLLAVEQNEERLELTLEQFIGCRGARVGDGTAKQHGFVELAATQGADGTPSFLASSYAVVENALVVLIRVERL